MYVRIGISFVTIVLSLILFVILPSSSYPSSLLPLTQSLTAQEFQQSFGRPEFCSMCLIVAAFAKPTEGALSQNAIQAFATYSGEASYGVKLARVVVVNKLSID
jgi:hypothetical protein